MTVLLVGPDADTLGADLADHGIEALAADDAAEVLAWTGDRHAPLDLSAVGLIAWAGDAVPSEVADLRAATGFEVCAVADLAGLLDLLDERGVPVTALRFALALLMLACCPQPAAALPFLPPDPDAPTPAASAYSDPMVWRSKVLAWAGLSAHTPDADEVDWWGEMHDAETAGTCEGCAAWAVVTGARAGG